MDVSSSVDPGEYRLQVDGLADALLDQEVAFALENGKVRLAVLQWSGAGQQQCPGQRKNSQRVRQVSSFEHGPA